MTELPRMSHSRYELYSGCGERYRLEKVEKLPRTPSIYAVAGTAFHEWSEFYDLEPTHPQWADEAWWTTHLSRAVSEAEEKSGYPLAQWDTPARGKDANQKAFEKFRDEIGPDMLTKYAAWRQQSDWSIADQLPPDTPHTDRDGNPEREPIQVGIEYRLMYRAGQVDDLAVIDRLFDTPMGLVAIDLKTWSKKRNSAQLPSYVIACRQNGINVEHAGYYDARKGEVTNLDPYEYWDEQRLAALHEQAARGIAAGFFLPRISDDCTSICAMRRHCLYAP